MPSGPERATIVPPPSGSSRPPAGAPVLLYDGLCGLCNRLNRFVLRRDRGERIWFAPLQSALAREILGRHGRCPGDLETAYLVLRFDTGDEALLDKARVVSGLLDELGRHRILSSMLRALPLVLSDGAYGFVARHRYRILGRHDRCPLPPPADRWRFIGPDRPSGDTA